MGYEKAGDIIRDAHKNKYGVISLNIFNYETVKFAADAAEQTGKPVLVQLYPGFQDYISYETTVEMTKQIAKKAKAPIGLHLDHCHDIEELKCAMRAGFMSVMYDGSKLPFSENLKTTCEAARAALDFGADLEAELGSIGSAADVAAFTDSAKFTDPDDARLFTGETGAFSLAVAVGNAHGNYAAVPNLDIPRIKKISEGSNIPLVLHGGSGIPDSQLQEAVKNGIAKINVATEYFHAFYSAAAGYMGGENSRKDIFSCMRAVKPEMIKFLADKINLLNDK